MDFAGKVALITGASRGIGSSIARDLACHNCNICINYNKSCEEAGKLKEEIQNNYNVDVMTIKADISNENEIISMVDTVIEKFGKIDILVNNAGISFDSLVEDKKVSDFQQILNTNLIGPFVISRYVAKDMLRRKKGIIINVSSTNGIDTYYPYSLDYDASKAGLISLTHNLAREYAPYIRINSVAPGWVNTDMNKNLDKDYMEDEKKKIYLNRFAECSEIAKVVTFLASDDASYINGEVIRVDGGTNHV